MGSNWRYPVSTLTHTCTHIHIHQHVYITHTHNHFVQVFSNLKTSQKCFWIKLRCVPCLPSPSSLECNSIRAPYLPRRTRARHKSARVSRHLKGRLLQGQLPTLGCRSENLHKPEMSLTQHLGSPGAEPSSCGFQQSSVLNSKEESLGFVPQNFSYTCV